jgi:hypothetical protein
MEQIGKGNTVSFYAESDEEFIVKKTKFYKEKYHPYTMIGSLNRKDSRKGKMDIFEILTTLSKAEIILFNDIKSNALSDTGIAVMHHFVDHPNIENTYRRLNKLIDANLIRKMISIENPAPEVESLKSNLMTPEKYTYMINPYLIIPWKFNLAKQIWDLIEPIKQQKE